MKKLLVFAIAIIGFSVASFGQVISPPAEATGNIVAAISITKDANLNFGNIVAGPGGSVELTTAGSRNPTGVTLAAGTVSAAKFIVTGEANSTFSISLPTTITLALIGTPAITMSVGTFTKAAVTGTLGTLNGITQEVLVGATLTVGADQARGIYQNLTDLKMTVNYN